MISLIWNSRKSKTNLLKKKVQQWLPKGLGGGRGDRLKGEGSISCWWKGSGLHCNTCLHRRIYILVKILSMGAFYYEFIKFCLSKVDSKKEQTIILKQNLKSQRNNLTRGSSGQYNLTRKRVRSHDFWIQYWLCILVECILRTKWTTKKYYVSIRITLLIVTDNMILKLFYISRRVQQKVHVLTALTVVLEAKQRAMNTKSKT